MKLFIIGALMVIIPISGALYLCRTPTSVAIFREITGMTGNTADSYTDKGQVKTENHAKIQSEVINLQPDVFDMLSNAEKATHVTNFATFAVPRIMTFESDNREQDLTKASQYFQQPDGWDNFLFFLKKYRLLRLYPGKSLNTSAVTLNDASIKDSKIDSNGQLNWLVQVPLEMTYDTGSQRWREYLSIEIIISRTNETSPSGHPMSIAITEIGTGKNPYFRIYL